MKEFSDQYLSILTNELKGINLTRIEESDEFYNKQILDSVIPLEKCKTFKKKINETGLYLDIGFGGGFPILPLAKKLPNIKFLGLEARRKKAEAVSKLAEHLDLKNVNLMHKRFEEIYFDTDCVISFKAVGKIHDLQKMFNIRRDVNVYIYFYKGPNVEELESIRTLPGWEKVEDVSFDVKYTEGRRIIAYKNKNVPHGTNKNLVNLTSLL